jgi:hypothetical protein
MGKTSRSTVPITCPHCQHEGPAFVYLLGRVSRCKKCRQTFSMPRNVRMDCPHCRALLRVPAELIGRDVACKFCHAMFRANPARAERRRPEPADLGSPESPSATEWDLSQIFGDHEDLREQIGRLRAEIDELFRRERREIEEIRSQVDRLAAVRSAFAREADGPDRPVRPAKPIGAPHSSIAKHISHANGHGLTLIAASPPAREPRGAARAKAQPSPGDAALRELIERLAGCEAMTDRLIARLRSAQEQRAEDRATFARVIERLHDELNRARDRFGPGRVVPDPSTERDDSGDGPIDAIAASPGLPDCGVA